MTDPNDVVLLLIDLQEQILERGRTNPPETVRARAATLVQAAEILKIPIVLSGVATGKEKPVFIPEVPGVVLPRKSPDALEDEATLAALKNTGRRQLAIGAVLTEVAACCSTRSAVREGFDVSLLVDVCSGTSTRTESAVLETLGLCGVRVWPVSTFLADMIENFTRQPGKSLLPLMRETYG